MLKPGFLMEHDKDVYFFLVLYECISDLSFCNSLYKIKKLHSILFMVCAFFGSQNNFFCHDSNFSHNNGVSSLLSRLGLLWLGLIAILTTTKSSKISSF